MCPSDKRILKNMIRNYFDSCGLGEEIAVVRIAEHLKDEVGNDFVDEIKNDILTERSY